MAYRSQRAAERRAYDPLDPAKQHAVVSAGSLVSKFVDHKVLAGASDASRALVTWRRIAGKRAAKHTVAVWLNQPKRGSGLPELVVYLDGNALMADLSTNAELFADRLAFAGLPVARVRFRLSRKAGQAAPQAEPEASATSGGPALASPGAQTATVPAELGPVRDPEPLTLHERARVKEACARLPEKLRKSASEAMKLSLQRQKSQTTTGKTPAP